MELKLISLFNKLASDVDLDPLTVKYCTQRIKSEGLKFLTVTLPKLSKAVIHGLETGHFDRSTLTCFAWKRQSLRYFTKFLDGIFDPRTGDLLPAPDALCIYLLRQLCEYFYKLAMDFTEDEVLTATQKFVSLDSSVPTSGEYDEQFVDQLRKDFETHYQILATATVSDILKYRRPRPGPGTFSQKSAYERATGYPWYVRKHNDQTVPESFKDFAYASRPLKRVFNFDEKLDANRPGYNSLRKAPMPTIANDLPISEVLFVPKDSRGPRTIVREPFPTLRYHLAFNMFAADHLERVSNARINFQDQAINRAIAQKASLDRGWATIDLRDASDSVSASIMAHIFRFSPGCGAFVKSRTPHCRLPSGQTIKLNKLSGMGSGLTFPSMSLLIHLAITRAIVDYYHIPYKVARLRVYVYGDDIIVPNNMVSIAMKALERVCLHVNKDKSFWRGRFRESCGGDFFGGQDVAPVRLKMSGAHIEASNSKCIISFKGSLAIVELERHCRELVEAGLLSLAEYYYNALERTVGTLPTVSGESPVLGRYSITPHEYEQDGTGTYIKVRAIMPVPLSEKHDDLDPYIFISKVINRCTMSLLEQRFFPSSSGSTYGEVEVPRRIKLKRQKISAFRLMG
jgi:hypothetical protein